MPRLRFLSAALLVVLASCKGDSTGSSPKAGRMTGLLDSSAWRGQAYGGIFQGELYVGSTRDRVEQHITANVPFRGVGHYEIKPGDGEYYETIGGDAVGYRAAATGGRLEVETYDAATGTITGTLSLTAAGSRGETRFRGGQFTIQAPTQN